MKNSLRLNAILVALTMGIISPISITTAVQQDIDEVIVSTTSPREQPQLDDLTSLSTKDTISSKILSSNSQSRKRLYNHKQQRDGRIKQQPISFDAPGMDTGAHRGQNDDDDDDTFHWFEDYDEPDTIIGGTDLDLTPSFLVSIGGSNIPTPNGHSCGGTVIHPNVVLTAAHCFESDNPLEWVDFNRYDLTSGTDLPVVRRMLTRPNTEVIIHPDRNRDKKDNDFAIICFTEPVENIPVKLNDDNNVPASGSVLEIIGWGDTDPNPDVPVFPNVPQTANLTHITNEDCVNMYGSIIDITDNMLCAIDATQATCQGDSGGPIMLHTDEGPLQVGVTSFGPTGCLVEDRPNVYARVSKQLDWIKEQIQLCSPTKAPTDKPTDNPRTSSTSTPTSSTPTTKPTTTSGKSAKAKQSKSKGGKSESNVQITAFDSMKASSMETATPFIKRTRKHASREIELKERI